MRWRTAFWVVGILVVGMLAVPLVLTLSFGSD